MTTSAASIPAVYIVPMEGENGTSAATSASSATYATYASAAPQPASNVYDPAGGGDQAATAALASAGEEPPPGEHLEEQHPEGPPVNRLVVVRRLACTYTVSDN